MRVLPAVAGILLLNSTSVFALEVTKEVCISALGDLGIPTEGYELKKSWGSEKHIFAKNTECFERSGNVYIRSNNVVFAEDGFFGKTSLEARDKVLSVQRDKRAILKSEYKTAVALAKKERNDAESKLGEEIQVQLQKIRQNDIPSSIASAMAADIVAKEEAENARIALNEKKAKLEAEKIAAKRAEEAEQKRKGFHCLSGWSGAQRFIVSNLKPKLNDPKSFEHIETLVSPEQNGRHRFSMQYRAKNGFGGMIIGTATGTYNNHNCEDVEFAQFQ